MLFFLKEGWMWRNHRQTTQQCMRILQVSLWQKFLLWDYYFSERILEAR